MEWCWMMVGADEHGIGVFSSGQLGEPSLPRNSHRKGRNQKEGKRKEERERERRGGGCNDGEGANCRARGRVLAFLVEVDMHAVQIESL